MFMFSMGLATMGMYDYYNLANNNLTDNLASELVKNTTNYFSQDAAYGVNALSYTVTGTKAVLNGIINLSQHRSNKTIQRINREIKTMDLIAQFDVIDALVKDMPTKCNYHAINTTIKQVIEHVETIKKELIHIHSKISEYNSRWFHFFRSEIPDMEKQLQEIKLHRDQLGKRIDMFFKVITTYSHIFAASNSTIRNKKYENICNENTKEIQL